MRGASVRGVRRLTSAGVLDSTSSTASKRNEGMADLSCASVAIWREMRASKVNVSPGAAGLSKPTGMPASFAMPNNPGETRSMCTSIGWLSPIPLSTSITATPISVSAGTRRFIWFSETSMIPAFLTTWRSEVRERSVSTRRAPLDERRRT